MRDGEYFVGMDIDEAVAAAESVVERFRGNRPGRCGRRAERVRAAFPRPADCRRRVGGGLREAARLGGTGPLREPGKGRGPEGGGGRRARRR